MSQGASLASIYEVLTISKDGKEQPLQGKTVNFNYYESLYSPVITGNLMFVDSGGSTPDKRENLTSIKDGLPITALEDLQVKIKTKFGTLDFTKDPFKVTSSPIMHQESNRQTVLLNLVNEKEIKNSEIPIFDRFVGKISDTVKKILQLPDNSESVKPIPIIITTHNVQKEKLSNVINKIESLEFVKEKITVLPIHEN